MFSQLTGAVGKGEQGLLLTSVAIITIFDSLIGGAALVYLSSRFSWLRLVGASYLWIVLVSVIASVGLYFFKVYPNGYLINVIVLSAISALTASHASLILGHQKISAYNLIQISVPLLTFLTCLFQWTIQNKLDYVMALYIAFGFSFALSVFYLWRFFPSTTDVQQSWSTVWRRMFALGFFNQLAHVLQLLSFRASYYILEQYQGTSAVGVYSNASSITESIWLIATSISLWQYAAISNAQDQQYTIQITEKLARFGLLAALIGVGFFLLLPADIYRYVFGPDFGEIQQLMWVLAPGVWVFTYALVVGHYFSGHGRYGVNAFASGVGLIFSILVSFTLIPSYGAFGGAIAASISYMVTSAVIVYYFLKDGAMFSVFPSKAELEQLFTQMRVLWRKS